MESGQRYHQACHALPHTGGNLPWYRRSPGVEMVLLLCSRMLLRKVYYTLLNITYLRSVRANSARSSPYTCSLKPDLESIKWRQKVIIIWTSGLLQLLENTCRIIMWSCNKKGLPIFSKRQLIWFLQFTTWFQQILRERKVLLRLEAKARCILNRGINHLVCQLDRAFLWRCPTENSAADFVLITSPGKTRIGICIFESQAVHIYQVATKTDIPIRLLAGQKDLYHSRVILLPVASDQTF